MLISYDSLFFFSKILVFYHKSICLFKKILFSSGAYKLETKTFITHNITATAFCKANYSIVKKNNFCEMLEILSKTDFYNFQERYILECIFIGFLFHISRYTISL